MNRETFVADNTEEVKTGNIRYMKGKKTLISAGQVRGEEKISKVRERGKNQSRRT